MRRLMRTAIALALIFTCFVFGSRIGVAQVEEIAIGNAFGLGARTMGMGGAFLAVADDFTTLYWNPAGLAQIRKFELYSSLSHSEQRVDTKFTRGRTAEVGSSKTRPNSIGLVYPLYANRGGFAFALGIIGLRILIRRLLFKDWIRPPTRCLADLTWMKRPLTAVGLAFGVLGRVSLYRIVSCWAAQ